MIASVLITGGSKEQRIQEAGRKIKRLFGFKTAENLQTFLKSPDYFLLESSGKQIGIEEIRNLQSNIIMRPFVYKFKTIVITDAESLTIPAQNAFLKTLEEPSEFTAIIMMAKQKTDLLPTIVSRCQITDLGPKNQTDLNEKESAEISERIKTIFSGDLGAKFLIAETEGKTKEQALIFLENLTTTARAMLLRDQTFKGLANKQKIILLLKNSLLTKKHIEANVNPRFALENLFLSC
jgi:DNA polymerase III delta prime subunit